MKMKTQLMDQKKIFANDDTNKESIFKIYKQLIQLKRYREQPNQKMRRGPKQTFLQRRHKYGQQAQEKMLNITNYQRNANQNYNEISPHTTLEWPSSKNLQTINSGEGVEKMEPSYTVGGNEN